MTFEFTRPAALPDLQGGLPFIQITLYYAEHEITIPAMVDSGTTMSILPYDIGLKLGFVWEEQTIPIDVGGTLEGAEGYGVLVRGKLVPFPPVALTFAWVNKTSQEVRTLLGQMNFFQHYKITFEAYANTFEIIPRPR